MFKHLLRAFLLPSLAVFIACDTPIHPKGEWKGYASIAEGRRIPFILELDLSQNPPTAAFRIGDELTPVPEVIVDEDSLLLIVSEYDAAFRLSWKGDDLSGRYERYRDDTTGFDVYAEPSRAVKAPSKANASVPLVGSFTVLRQFRDRTDSSYSAVFWVRADSIFGTFIAPSGDDGLLAGRQDGDTVRLSRFTGWQSIHLELVREGSGWSGRRFIRDGAPSDFRLQPRLTTADAPSPEGSTTLRKGLDGFTFQGITPEGDTLDHTSERFRGKALIIDIMGTWCHNCLDGAPLLQSLYQEYGPRGLEVVSLSFELRDDPLAGRRNIEIFRKRHGLTYTLLYCGDISRENVSERIGSQLENFGAYPTAIFVRPDGKVSGIHKGFRGPGTGEGFQKEIAYFYDTVDKLVKN